MGLFFTGTFRDGTWHEGESLEGAALVVDIHDSDIGTIKFTPAGVASGCFYLGTHPRDYFGDPSEGASVDVDREVAGFVRWVGAVTGAAVDTSVVFPLVAQEGDESDPPFVFVEDALQALLEAAQIPMPPELVA